MNNLSNTLVIQIVASVATVAAGITVLCLIGLFTVDERIDLFIILSIAVPALVLSWAYLRNRKVSWEEYLEAVWFIALPW